MIHQKTVRRGVLAGEWGRFSGADESGAGKEQREIPAQKEKGSPGDLGFKNLLHASFDSLI